MSGIPPLVSLPQALAATDAQAIESDFEAFQFNHSPHYSLSLSPTQIRVTLQRCRLTSL